MGVPENLRIFTLLSVLYSFFFFLVIYQYVPHESWWVLTLITFTYSALTFYTAGSLAKEAEMRGKSKAFAFHLSAYLTVNIVHALFFVFDWVSAGATLVSVGSTALLWGVVLAFHGYSVGRKAKKAALAG